MNKGPGCIITFQFPFNDLDNNTTNTLSPCIYYIHDCLLHKLVQITTETIHQIHNAKSNANRNISY